MSKWSDKVEITGGSKELRASLKEKLKRQRNGRGGEELKAEVVKKTKKGGG